MIKEVVGDRPRAAERLEGCRRRAADDIRRQLAARAPHHRRLGAVAGGLRRRRPNHADTSDQGPDRDHDADCADDDGHRGPAACATGQRPGVHEGDRLLGRHALEEVPNVLVVHVVTSGIRRRVSSPRATSERTVARPAAQYVGDLGLVEVFVVAKDDRGALPRWQREQRRTHRFVRGDVSIGAAFAELGGPPLEVRPLDRPPPEDVFRQVDDRAAEVGIEGLRLSKVMESPYEPEEGLLDKILGQGSIASQRVREPETRPARPARTYRPTRSCRKLRIPCRRPSLSSLRPHHLDERGHESVASFPAPPHAESASSRARICSSLWALRVSNPRPSPCKGDALPAELSARFRGGVAARPADHVAELDRQPRAAARGAPVQAVGPSRLRLTRRADQYLPPAGHRSRPRHRTLVGVVGRTAASPACRSIHRLVGSVERPHVARIQGHTHPFPHVD